MSKHKNIKKKNNYNGSSDNVNSKDRSSNSSSASSSSSTSEVNQPRNWIVTDATQPYIYRYYQFGKPVSIRIDQTPNDETWPGGALWDIGILLANVLVCIGGYQCFPTPTSSSSSATTNNSRVCHSSKTNKKNKTTSNGISGTTTNNNNNKKSNLTPPKRLLEAMISPQNQQQNQRRKQQQQQQPLQDMTVLELGCGVGLTGIVASAVLKTQLTILTDLNVVVSNVTQPNVDQNSTVPPPIRPNSKTTTTASTTSTSNNNSTKQRPPYRILSCGRRGRILSMPLCWGNANDEELVLDCFRRWTKLPHTQQSSSSRTKSKSKPTKNASNDTNSKSNDDENGADDDIDDDEIRDPGQPDIILIGDVAYQHGGVGEPSHFDALVSTLLRFLGPHTVVLFGTRQRMPASIDLLEMFRTYMDETVDPPIAADEIDPSFASFKHQITVHVFRRKKKQKN